MMYEPIFRGFRKACPKCSQGRLIWRNWRYRQNVTRSGLRSRDHIVYYECDRCGCRLKIFRGGLVKNVDEGEWVRYCVYPLGQDPGEEQSL